MSATRIFRMLSITGAVSASMSLIGCSAIGDVINAVNNGPGPAASSAFEIAVGDCFLEPKEDSDGIVSKVVEVDCSLAHDYEAFFAVNLQESTIPGDDELFGYAEDVCAHHFFEFIGADKDSGYDGSAYFNYFVPTEGSWESGDREVLCYAYDENGLTTGTLKNFAN